MKAVARPPSFGSFPHTNAMKIIHSPIRILLFLAAVILFTAVSLPAQNAPNQIKRTVHKTDTLEFGSGGTVSVVGAPKGSIVIQGWANNSVEITAAIELNAATEEELDLLESVTGFVLEESIITTGITSVGVHNKKHVKRTAGKKFPKHLYDSSFRIDYVVKVPQYTDLEIDGGDGLFELSGVIGAMKINFLKTNAKLQLIGGGISGTFGDGTVDVLIPTRGWRGAFVELNLATGTMNVELPPGLSAEFDASILRTGKINNTYEGLKKKKRKDIFTPAALSASSGSGGVPLKLTVGDGDINIFPLKHPE